MEWLCFSKIICAGAVVGARVRRSGRSGASSVVAHHAHHLHILHELHSLHVLHDLHKLISAAGAAVLVLGGLRSVLGGVEQFQFELVASASERDFIEVDFGQGVSVAEGFAEADILFVDDVSLGGPVVDSLCGAGVSRSVLPPGALLPRGPFRLLPPWFAIPI